MSFARRDAQVDTFSICFVNMTRQDCRRLFHPDFFTPEADTHLICAHHELNTKCRLHIMSTKRLSRDKEGEEIRWDENSQALY